jgi:hypothetical protein
MVERSAGGLTAEWRPDRESNPRRKLGKLLLAVGLMTFLGAVVRLCTLIKGIDFDPFRGYAPLR